MLRTRNQIPLRNFTVAMLFSLRSTLDRVFTPRLAFIGQAGLFTYASYIRYPEKLPRGVTPVPNLKPRMTPKSTGLSYP